MRSSNVYLQSHPGHQYSPFSMTHYLFAAAVGLFFLFAGKPFQGGPSRDSQVEVAFQRPRYASCPRHFISFVKHGQLATDHQEHLFTSSTMIPFLLYSLYVGH